MAHDVNTPDWIERGRQILAEQAQKEEAAISELREIQKQYIEATRKLFEELKHLAQQLGLQVQQAPPKVVTNTFFEETFEISGDLLISHGRSKSLRLIPGDLVQNFVPAAFSGIKVETQPPGLLPFNELFFAERSQSWVVRVPARTAKQLGKLDAPVYETKSIAAEDLIKAAFIPEISS